MVKILFVCLGNICRSPAAEAIMNHLVKKKDLEKNILCDSAGTSAHHEGSPADERMIHHAEKKGYHITSISRPVKSQDFETFDWIITMDQSVFHSVLRMAPSPSSQKKVKNISEFNTQKQDISDPYRGGDEGFLKAISLLEESCLQFLKKLTTTN